MAVVGRPGLGDLPGTTRRRGVPDDLSQRDGVVVHPQPLTRVASQPSHPEGQVAKPLRVEVMYECKHEGGILKYQQVSSLSLAVCPRSVPRPLPLCHQQAASPQLLVRRRTGYRHGSVRLRGSCIFGITCVLLRRAPWRYQSGEGRWWRLRGDGVVCDEGGRPLSQ